MLNEVDWLQQGQSRTCFVFAPGAKNLRATMTYSDPAGTPSAYPSRVNILDLRVVGPTGTGYWGNVGLNTGLYSTAGGAANTGDTVENVWVQNAPKGYYQVTVSAPLVAADSHKEKPALDADFALVVSGISGLRDQSGMKLALSSAAAGDFKVSMTNLPAGWADGYTVFSVTTTRPVSFGNFFGVEFDGLSLGCMSSAAAVGNVFYFSPTATSVFPNTDSAFPAGLAFVLTGTTFDAVALTFDGTGAMNGVSNAARVKIQCPRPVPEQRRRPGLRAAAAS